MLTTLATSDYRIAGFLRWASVFTIGHRMGQATKQGHRRSTERDRVRIDRHRPTSICVPLPPTHHTVMPAAN